MKRLAELEILAGERAGGAGIFSGGESWRSCKCWLGRDLAELELLPGERAGRAGFVRELAELELLAGERAGGASFVDFGW